MSESQSNTLTFYRRFKKINSSKQRQSNQHENILQRKSKENLNLISDDNSQIQLNYPNTCTHSNVSPLQLNQNKTNTSSNTLLQKVLSNPIGLSCKSSAYQSINVEAQKLNTLSKLSDNQSSYSQPPLRNYDEEKYNIFTEEAKLKRLALQSSNSHKKAKGYSSQKGAASLLIQDDHLSLEQSRDLEKKHRIFKSKEKTIKRSPIGKLQIIKVKNKVQDYTDDDDENDIINASSHHASRSTTRNMQNQFKNTNEDYLLATDSSITPQSNRRISTLKDAKFSSYLLQNNNQAYDDQHSIRNHQAMTQQNTIQFSQLQQTSPLTKNQRLSQTVINNMANCYSPSQNEFHNQSLGQIILSQEAIRAIRKKMEIVAKELSENDDIGLDEQTLLKLFEGRTEKFMNLSCMSNLNMIEKNIQSPKSQLDNQQLIGESFNIQHNEIVQNDLDESIGKNFGSPILKDTQNFMNQQSQLRSEQQDRQSKDFKDTFALKDCLQNSKYDQKEFENCYIRNIEGDSTVIIQGNETMQYSQQNLQNDTSHHFNQSSINDQSKHVSTQKKQRKNHLRQSSKHKSNKSNKIVAHLKVKSTDKKSYENQVSTQRKSPYRTRTEIYNNIIPQPIFEEEQNKIHNRQNSQQEQYISIQDNFIQQMPNMYHQVDSNEFQHNSQCNLQRSHQDSNIQRQYSITPAFADSSTNFRRNSQISQNKSKSNLQKNNNNNPSTSSLYQSYTRQPRTKTPIQHSNKRESLSQSRISKYSKSQLRNTNTKINLQNFKCNCIQKFRESKEVLKKALKVKYESRLKSLKNEFDHKFRKNEHIWKQRLDYHKSMLNKEHQRADEYLKTIQEMTKRIENVEKKNKDLYKLIQQQNTNQPQLIQKETSQKRLISNPRKIQSYSSDTSSEEEINQQENIEQLANIIKGDEDKLKRIEKILYKSKQ